VKDVPQSKTPSAVPSDKPGGSKQLEWSWAQPGVWTERMLAALETGMKEKQWYSLMDKVYGIKTLQLAWEKVYNNAGGSGVDGMSVTRFAKDCPRGLLVLNEHLRLGRYEPLPVKRVWIPKPGTNEKRPLGIPAVRDRIVQTALRMVLEPIFEQNFAQHSYGFRPGRGCKDALRRVQHLLDSGKNWVVDADLKSYFDTIPHKRLMARVAERVADSKVLGLIQRFLKQGIMDAGSLAEAGEEGTPQGAVMSPLLANIYLNEFDHTMAAKGFEMVRYADDFVIVCDDQQQAQQALKAVQDWMQANGLNLHPQKTRIVDMLQPGGFDFLGYHFEGKHRYPRKKSMERFKAKVREMTRRTSGESMPCIIARLNPVLRGWFEYYKHCHRLLYAYTDSRIRSRLRCILRRRSRRSGLGHIPQMKLWPNLYFKQMGLFSLAQAHAALCRSP
jgi:RNA-directed DNA polymerase